MKKILPNSLPELQKAPPLFVMRCGGKQQKNFPNSLPELQKIRTLYQKQTTKKTGTMKFAKPYLSPAPADLETLYAAAYRLENTSLRAIKEIGTGIDSDKVWYGFEFDGSGVYHWFEATNLPDLQCSHSCGAYSQNTGEWKGRTARAAAFHVRQAEMFHRKFEQLVG